MIRKSILIAAMLLCATTARAEWFSGNATDPFDDSVRYFAWTRSLSGDGSPKLHIRCEDSETEIFITVGRFLTSRPTLDARWRFDKKPHQSGKMSLSTDNQGAFFVDVNGILDNLLSSDSLIVELQTPNSKDIVLAFAVYGLEEKMADIRKHCDL